MRSVAVVGLTLVAVCGFAACAGTREVRAGSPSNTAATTTVAAVVPSHPTKLTLNQVPDGSVELRLQTTKLPNSNTSYVVWYGRPSYGPTITTNVTVGPDAGSWMSTADVHAAAVGAKSGAPNSALLPAPVHTTVNGSPAIVYADASGWTSESWSPRPDLLLAVTAYHSSFTSVEALATHAVIE